MAASRSCAARVGDDREALTTAFERCLDQDLVLFSGGTSVGERDYLLEIIAAAGTVHFEGLQLKPGKPTVFATVAGRPVFGMPGNPVSCLTNAYLLVAPLLRRMAHLPPAAERVVLARLATRSARPPAGIRFIRSASMAPRPCRCSRDRAKSRAWRIRWLLRDTGGDRIGRGRHRRRSHAVLIRTLDHLDPGLQQC